MQHSSSCGWRLDVTLFCHANKFFWLSFYYQNSNQLKTEKQNNFKSIKFVDKHLNKFDWNVFLLLPHLRNFLISIKFQGFVEFWFRLLKEWILWGSVWRSVYCSWSCYEMDIEKFMELTVTCAIAHASSFLGNLN